MSCDETIVCTNTVCNHRANPKTQSGCEIQVYKAKICYAVRYVQLLLFTRWAFGITFCPYSVLVLILFFIPMLLLWNYSWYSQETSDMCWSWSLVLSDLLHPNKHMKICRVLPHRSPQDMYFQLCTKLSVLFRDLPSYVKKMHSFICKGTVCGMWLSQVCGTRCVKNVLLKKILRKTLLLIKMDYSAASLISSRCGLLLLPNTLTYLVKKTVVFNRNMIGCYNF